MAGTTEGIPAATVLPGGMTKSRRALLEQRYQLRPNPQLRRTDQATSWREYMKHARGPPPSTVHYAAQKLLSTSDNHGTMKNTTMNDGTSKRLQQQQREKHAVPRATRPAHYRYTGLGQAYAAQQREHQRQVDAKPLTRVLEPRRDYDLIGHTPPLPQTTLDASLSLSSSCGGKNAIPPLRAGTPLREGSIAVPRSFDILSNQPFVNAAGKQNGKNGSNSSHHRPTCKPNNNGAAPLTVAAAAALARRAELNEMHVRGGEGSLTQHRDFDVITTRSFLGPDVDEAVRRMRDTEARLRVVTGRHYNPVTAQYYDDEMEAQFQKQRAHVQTRHGLVKLSRMPTAVRRSEGVRYDIINASRQKMDLDVDSNTDCMGGKARRRRPRLHYESQYAKKRDEHAELARQRREARVSYKRFLHDDSTREYHLITGRKFRGRGAQTRHPPNHAHVPVPWWKLSGVGAVPTVVDPAHS